MQELVSAETAVTMAEPLTLRIRIVKTNTLKMMQVSVRGECRMKGECGGEG